MKKSFREICNERVDRSINFDVVQIQKFDIKHLEASKRFVDDLDKSCKNKIENAFKKVQRFNDPALFKKLTELIWEFRINCRGLHHRLKAFWHTENDKSMVLTTHGFTKKTSKVPQRELDRAVIIRHKYLDK